jgi:hypothetical protein
MSDPSPAGMFGGDRDREILHVITQETRFVLLQNIIGHPKQLPSVPELTFFNPDKNEGTIYQHLKRLINIGIVEIHTLPSDQREQDLPFKFYGISEEGEAFLDQYGVFESEETLHDIYARVDKSERMKRFESAPRPR